MSVLIAVCSRNVSIETLNKIICTRVVLKCSSCARTSFDCQSARAAMEDEWVQLCNICSCIHSVEEYTKHAIIPDD